MSFTLTPTTELDAVNELLATIGEAPVNTLTNTGLGDASTARTRLYNASRNLQKYGWSWNTDYSFNLLPDVNGNVAVPSTTLQVRFVAKSDRQNLTLRGTQIYDSQNHTYTFTQPVMADIVQMLDFSLLPETARQAIFIAAGIRFQAGFIGSQILDTFTARDLKQAWDALQSDDLEVADWNMLSDSADQLWANNRLAVYGGSFGPGLGNL